MFWPMTGAAGVTVSAGNVCTGRSGFVSGHSVMKPAAEGVRQRTYVGGGASDAAQRPNSVRTCQGPHAAEVQRRLEVAVPRLLLLDRRVHPARLARLDVRDGLREARRIARTGISNAGDQRGTWGRGRGDAPLTPRARPCCPRRSRRPYTPRRRPPRGSGTGTPTTAGPYTGLRTTSDGNTPAARTSRLTRNSCTAQARRRRAGR